MPNDDEACVRSDQDGACTDPQTVDCAAAEEEPSDLVDAIETESAEYEAELDRLATGIEVLDGASEMEVENRLRE